MPTLLHQIKISASPERVFDAIATADGLRGWWTTDVIAEPIEGSIAEFGFNRRATVFRMRVDELVPGRRITWSCLGGHDEWEGTSLEFHLSPEDGGGVDLRFAHQDWRSLAGAYAVCNTTWGELMYRLKFYAETDTPDPLFG